MIFTEAEKSIFKKRTKTLVSKWASENVIVPDGPYSNARYRKDVNPYLVGIMDCWGQREIEEVIVCGAPQVGKTLLLYSCLAYCVDYRPAPRMLAMPDDETMKAVVNAKLKPLLKKCRSIAKNFEIIKGRQVKFKDSTAIWLSSAASPSQRASISIQDLFLDEEALYMRYAGKGDPVTDLVERTNSYANTRKILRISKPIGSTSSITRALKTCDEVREYYCVCPACGVAAVIDEKNFTLLEETDDLAKIEREKLGRYTCPDCSLEWSDALRNAAVKNGFWQAKEKVANAKRIGFHLPGWLSASVSLSSIAAFKKELENSDDPERHQAYANSIKAEDYTRIVHKTSEEELYKLIDKALPSQVAPADTLALTLGVDMQKRGFYFAAYAWNKQLKPTLIDYGQLSTFDDVYELAFNASYPKENSEERLIFFRALLDSGGGKSDMDDITRTEQAYAFASQYGQNFFYVSKGASHQQITPIRMTTLERMPKTKYAISGGLPLYILDTDYFKSLVTSKLSSEAKAPITFHAECGKDLFKQMTAEEVVLESGKRKWKLKAGHKDNHYFDCSCLAFAAAHNSFVPSLSTLFEVDLFGIEQAVEVETQISVNKRKKRNKTGGSLW